MGEGRGVKSSVFLVLCLLVLPAFSGASEYAITSSVSFETLNHPAQISATESPVADAGGPYSGVEGSPVILDGKGSRGSSEDDLAFTTPIIVNPTVSSGFDVLDTDASMAMGPDGTAYAVWLREMDDYPVQHSILFSRRASGGTFSTPIEIDTGRWDTLPATPSVLVQGSTVLVAWAFENWSDPDRVTDNILLRQSLDEGMTFSPPILVRSWIPPRYSYGSGCYHLRVLQGLFADKSGGIYLLWREPDYYPWETLCNFGDLYLSRSADGGVSFSNPTRINSVAKAASKGNLALGSNDTVYVVWEVDSLRSGNHYGVVLLTKSFDKGVNFSPPVVVTEPEARVGGWPPRIVVDSSDTIHVMWNDGRDCSFACSRLWYSKSVDGGATFSPNRVISDQPDFWETSFRGYIAAAEDGSLYLFDSYYHGYRQPWPGASELWFSVSRDHGDTFTPSVRVDTFNSWQYANDIVVRGHNISLLWTDYSMKRVPGKAWNVLYAEVSEYAPIVSYQWDKDANTDSDGDGNPANDVDATGPNPSVVYGDNGNYTLILRIRDSHDRTAQASTYVLVENVPPTIEDIDCTVGRPDAEAWARIAGEKWHDVRVSLYENGVETNSFTMLRAPGSPNEQEAFLGEVDSGSGINYSVTMTYTPEDDDVNGQPGGATPAWVILRTDGGNETSVHHLFNVEHPDTWTWDIYNLVQRITVLRVTCEATASDPGSDSLSFHWDFGDGTNLTTLHPVVNGTFPMRVTDMVIHTFLGGLTSRITLTVTDDDGGSATKLISLLTRRTAVISVRIVFISGLHPMTVNAPRSREFLPLQQLERPGGHIPGDPRPLAGH